MLLLVITRSETTLDMYTDNIPGRHLLKLN